MCSWMCVLVGVLCLGLTSAGNVWDTADKTIDTVGKVSDTVNRVTTTIMWCSIAGVVAFIAMIVGCCYCCGKCCFQGGGNNTTLVVAGNQPAPTQNIYAGPVSQLPPTVYQAPPTSAGYQPLLSHADAPAVEKQQVPLTEFSVDMKREELKTPPPYSQTPPPY